MCGIGGFYKIKDRSNGLSILETMTALLAHRGPDDKGTWLSPEGDAGLAHTRLAVIDIEGGKQPMESADGRYFIVFNGEVYNFQDLRKTLESMGGKFRTQSDTEVVLEAYRQWGRACLKRFHGMFAFAIYDKENNELFLSRDKTGIKPLYYYSGHDGFYFGSEIKAILSVKGIPRRINYHALVDYFMLGYPLLPSTFFSNIYELEPGTWLQVSQKGLEKGSFWSWERDPADWNELDALENGEKAIIESLQEHMIADVPIGAFLSGGIDSSLLVAMIVKNLGLNIETFTVSFTESAYDESEYAKLVSKHLGTRHHEILVDLSHPDLSLVDNVLLQFDQPFGDSSAIPTFLICREIRKYFKVAISGDGGDEMFGGYKRFWYADVAKHLGMLPGWLTKFSQLTSKGFERFTPNLCRQIQRLLLAGILKDERRVLILSCYSFPDEINEIFNHSIIQMINGYVPSLSPNGKKIFNPGGAEFIDSTIKFQMPGKYLRKVDMMSSVHGLEVRVPFLGEHILDFAVKIPDNMKYSYRSNKLLLRKLAQRYLPKQVVEKPKAGFEIPLDSWLGKKGREEIHAILNSPKACIRDLIRSEYIEPILTGFVKQDWDKTKYSRHSLNQRVYFLWSLEKWLCHWSPSL